MPRALARVNPSENQPKNHAPPAERRPRIFLAQRGQIPNIILRRQPKRNGLPPRTGKISTKMSYRCAKLDASFRPPTLDAQPQPPSHGPPRSPQSEAQK